MNLGRRRFLQAVGLTPVAPKAMLAPTWKPIVISGLSAWLPDELPKTPCGRIEMLMELLAVGAISQTQALNYLGAPE